jgi:hypothetical protein
LFAYSLDDLEDIIRHYLQTGERPAYIELADRSRLDIDGLANHVVQEEMSDLAKRDYLARQWMDNETLWQAFFGHKQRSFIQEVDHAIQRALYPELFEADKPSVIHPPRDIEDLSLFEIRQVNPALYQSLSESVYDEARRKDGMYVCALSGFTSPERRKFEIDHIEPMANGGKTVRENLRLLERSVNRALGAALLKRQDAR